MIEERFAQEIAALRGRVASLERQEFTAGGGGGGAPTDAQYVTLATNATLTQERVLTAGALITVTDGGAGSTVTVAVDSAKLAWTSGKVTINGTATVAGGGASCTLTLPNAGTTVTGGGTLALGGYTLTVPATGSVALLNTANSFSVNQSIAGVIVSTATTGVPAATGTNLYMCGGVGSPITGQIFCGDGLGWRLEICKRTGSVTTALFKFYDVGDFTASAKFGCNGQAARAAYSVNAASTDLATVIALCNQIRLALIANGICV